MGQTFAGRKGSELATVEAADAVVAAGEPQVPVSILVDGAHAAGCETVFFGVGGEALAIVAGDGRASHLGGGGAPELPVSILKDGGDIIAGQAVRRGKAGEALPVEAAGAAVGGEPDIASLSWYMENTPLPAKPLSVV
jgi:hypothetical protein